MRNQTPDPHQSPDHRTGARRRRDGRWVGEQSGGFEWDCGQRSADGGWKVRPPGARAKSSTAAPGSFYFAQLPDITFESDHPPLRQVRLKLGPPTQLQLEW